jgi:uncharacterized protein (DUF302 family)
MKKIKALFIALTVGMLATTVTAEEKKLKFEDFGFSIAQTVYKVPVSEGVSAEDVHDSIMSKGAELNMKFVGHQPLSKELTARGVDGGQVDIYQFCNPMDARKMIDYNPIFVAYMPCRVAMVEDKDGQLWLMMVNLDMLINNTKLPAELKAMADEISNKLKLLIENAKEGEL